jgi:hypothetical protein
MDLQNFKLLLLFHYKNTISRLSTIFQESLEVLYIYYMIYTITQHCLKAEI